LLTLVTVPCETRYCPVASPTGLLNVPLRVSPATISPEVTLYESVGSVSPYVFERESATMVMARGVMLIVVATDEASLKFALCALVAVTLQVVPTLPVAVSTPAVIEQPAPLSLNEYDNAPSPSPPVVARFSATLYVVEVVVMVMVGCVARPIVNFADTNVI
jgi:hypothetical protein